MEIISIVDGRVSAGLRGNPMLEKFGDRVRTGSTIVAARGRNRLTGVCVARLRDDGSVDGKTMEELGSGERIGRRQPLPNPLERRGCRGDCDAASVLRCGGCATENVLNGHATYQIRL
jgi:hypothetical protein